MKTALLRSACLSAILLIASTADAGPLRRAFNRVRFGPPVVIQTAEPPLAFPCGPSCPCVDCPCGKPSTPLFIAPAQPMPQKPGVVPVEVNPVKPPQVVAEPKSAPPVVQQSPAYNPSCPGGNCGEVRRRFFR